MIAIPYLYARLTRLKNYELYLLFAGAALITLPFFIGETKHGAANWITFGPLSFQPSEAVKLIFIAYLARAMAGGSKKPRDLAVPAAYGAFITLVLVLQRDLGGALIFFVVFLFMLYIATGSAAMTLGAAVCAAAACAAAYAAFPGLFAHVAVRVTAWLNPWGDVDAGGYQITQALFAIGTWGVFGSGLTRGYPGKIPVAASDFVFPAVCEEFGLLYGLCVIGVIMLSLYYGYAAAVKNKTVTGALFTIGLVLSLTFQGFLSIGGNIKLIPHTGVTLPFMSYGGSSLAASMLSAAFVVKGDGAS